MKKEVLFILLLFFLVTFLSSSIYADCDITGEINESNTKSYEINNKDYNITFLDYDDSTGKAIVKFKVNGETTKEMEKTDYYIFMDASLIRIDDIEKIGNVAQVQFCFKAGLSCIDCGSCSTNSDCDDGNACTIDYCDGDPLICHHKLILWCKNNDGCCPKRCTLQNDNDCIKESKNESKIVLCVNDSECDDNNTATKDVCSGTPKRCNHILIDWCLSGDGYCPENCTFEDDTDCDECLSDIDCDDGNACTKDVCSGNPKRCLNNRTAGCDYNGVCFSIGSRVNNLFCNTNGSMEVQKAIKESCNYDYECYSNRCIRNRCKFESFFDKLIQWIRSIF